VKPEERQEFAQNILTDLYRETYLETIFNTEEEKFLKEGWTLKSGIWSPWFFNLRPIGASPRIVAYIAYVMNHLIQDEVWGERKCTLVGVEMAGVPLVSAIATAQGPGCQLMPYAYTRPLPVNIRTPLEAEEVLKDFDYKWGHKSLVEGVFRNGAPLCILDDMVTNFGSKLITRYVLEREMRIRNISNVEIKDVAVVLDREQGGEEEAEKNGMRLHSLIKWTEGLGWLKNIMLPEEYNLILDYQSDPMKYMDKNLQRKVLEEAQKARTK